MKSQFFFMDCLGGGRRGKTLLFLEGCARPELGCTLLLRGGSENELARAKRVVSWLMFSAHAWRSELAFLMDIHAWPPPTAKEDDDPFFPKSDAKEETRSDNETTTLSIPILRTSCQAESVRDHSDPLRAAADAEAEGLVPVPPPPEPASVSEPFQDRRRFRQALEGAVLTTSPYIRVSYKVKDIQSFHWYLIY